ncbi:MAG: bifunctional diguanylate cyclase/phosphodiesterase, partial [Burkholderiales bacterium]|nr:bifunctional diguanylate cyclase/phosphodiesterase [Burkholderiales bacterium]
RALLRERLQQVMTGLAADDRYGALLLLDWDNFKAVNDSLGYSAGDLLLQQIGQRLQQAVPSGVVARLDGDAFAVLLHPLEGTLEQAAARAEARGEEIRQALSGHYPLGTTDCYGSASAGLVLFSGREADGDDLLKQAEIAMYRAKSDGRDRLHFFDVALERAITERMQLERELRAAIGADALRLYYQPQFAAQNGTHAIVGAEALVRWQHPQRGLLGPGHFIALAEESGLILALGRWVLHAACAQLAAWQGQPALCELVLAVNVSVAQFLQDGFAADVLQLLERSGAPADRLKLELTESMLASDVDAVIATMTALKQRGVRFALDDFGTGYSSLSYLKRLPLDQLKIDQSFVRDMETDGDDAAIARAVVMLARSLELEVIAEGVETAAQRDLLAALGCTVYQGYFFARPLAPAAFEDAARRSQDGR